MQFKNGVIVVSDPNVTRVYAVDARTGQTLQTLQGNEGKVFWLRSFDGELAVIGSPNSYRQNQEMWLCCDIYIWCVKDGSRRQIPTVDPIDMNRMDYRDKMLAAVDDDNYIRVWNVRSGECLHKLKCPGKKSTVQLGDNVIFGLTTVGEVCVSVWSQDTGECQRVIRLPSGEGDLCECCIVNNFILLNECCPREFVGLNTYAYDLDAKLVAKGLMYYFDLTDHAAMKGSKLILRGGVSHSTRRMSPEQHSVQKKDVSDLTPNGLVRLFDINNVAVWIDDIVMILYDPTGPRLVLHYYW